MAADGDDRLEQAQVERIEQQVSAFQDRLMAAARRRVPNGAAAEGGLFFSVLFQLAASAIETDVDAFCDRADEIFEEIEAYGQEPLLDTDWLSGLTGHRDTYHFSTDNLVSDLVSPPRRPRRRKSLSDEEKEKLRQEVEAAIIDEVPQTVEQALAVAHGENVDDWVCRIRRALTGSRDGLLEFWLLQEETRLKPVELFLGLLLGHEHWQITQTDGFFSKVHIALYEQVRENGRGEEDGKE